MVDVAGASEEGAVAERVLTALQQWFDDLPHTRAGMPARGSIAAALAVTERLKEDFSLDLADHRAEGGAQIRGTGGHAVAAILARHGDERSFLAEGGRTNRGAPAAIEALLQRLTGTGIEDLSNDDRNRVLEGVQRFLVEKVAEYHSRERIRFNFSDQASATALVARLMATAREQGQAGEVAQHLVGAKLQLRFPGAAIQNETTSTADAPTGRPGDFAVGDAAFHVTVAPQPGVMERCQRNLNDGIRPQLVVPADRLAAAKELAEQASGEGIAVLSLEQFVAQNVEELGGYSADGFRDQLAALLVMYNARVDAVELDKSLLIALPPQLEESADRMTVEMIERGLLRAE